MRDYDLTKQYMAEKMQQAENARLVKQIKLSNIKSNRLFSLIKRSQPAMVSAEKTTGTPAHQFTPSGTL
jgi:hypothetical protein